LYSDHPLFGRHLGHGLEVELQLIMQAASSNLLALTMRHHDELFNCQQSWNNDGRQV